MFTETDISAINHQLNLMQAHTDAAEKCREKILMILAKQKKPISTGLGERIVAELNAKSMKKTA